jgi:hypothetical protein
MRLGGLVAIIYRYRGKPVTLNPRRRLDLSSRQTASQPPKGKENTKQEAWSQPVSPSERTARGAHRVWGVSRGHIKPVETSRASQRREKYTRRPHPGEGPNGAACRMAGVNESGQ